MKLNNIPSSIQKSNKNYIRRPWSFIVCLNKMDAYCQFRGSPSNVFYKLVYWKFPQKSQESNCSVVLILVKLQAGGTLFCRANPQCIVIFIIFLYIWKYVLFIVIIIICVIIITVIIIIIVIIVIIIIIIIAIIKS